ncbi:lactococcin 972 family bacteriocin [Streptomyces sp. NBC_00525]|uniref:lactococcin 972 family bacteriocin n=1 Tax=Streptomyces sp. NBC_00525 TaxID=2903660 RepID=UPI002E809927|nr:lactococcin 972 family bacteriocin [Streptomyces sp. NBC_00525]WUC95082.1 lactococcin 972 family bacteriocin [Streptomyces sp. NBC_00525]
MKITGRSVALVVAGAALTAGSFATPAVADSSQLSASASASTPGVSVTVHHRGDGTQPPAALGNPSEWGVVTIKMDDSAGTVRPLSEACVNASGGKWCYGWYTTEVSTGNFRKYCYSNYYHYTKGHSSTVKIAGGTNKDWAPANGTSNAHLTAGFAYTCSTYYSID